ncbi:hypothetical protein U9M48_024822 [Paspalum notatum var. saurae]|uniref:Fucosyltransferase n=1 Tax=Paspalum notatum var. saurae TaxID=547442 RepID=A0AAQ3WWD4_PASNO
MDVKGGSSSSAADRRSAEYRQRSSPVAAAAFHHPEALMWKWWQQLSEWGTVRTTKRARSAVCVAAAVAVAMAIIVLSAGGGGSPVTNEMPWYSFIDSGQGDMKNLTADHHLLDGLLTAEFPYGSCRSRYEFSMYHKKSLFHKPSPYLLSKLRKQEELQRRCGPGTAGYKKAMRQLNSSDGAAAAEADDDCRYLVYISLRGLGNRMLAIASSFLYAVLTERALLIDGSKDTADLFCEPFPGTSWLLPRGGRSSALRHLDRYDEGSPVSLGNMLQNGSIVMSADRSNVSWSSPRRPPSHMLLHLAGGYGFNDKLFYCDTVQKLIHDVPWLLMRTDSYLVPGLFLTPIFLGELEAMFPEKEAAFYHLGRYLFHPSNGVWHAVTSYYRSYLAGAGRRVGVQIRVYQKKQPPQQVLDQLLSCIRDEKLLPEAAAETTTASNNGTSDAVLVTSLSSWYHEQLAAEYGGRVAGGVHQPSQEGEQRWGDTAHDMRALSEIYLLSTLDVLVTSGFSTFGYVAQGLAGLRPWVMSRPSPWEEWTEGQAAPEPACQRALSVEPCFHSPSYYDCAAGRDVELDKVTPYIRRCVDVSWGIKLVNQSSSQW